VRPSISTGASTPGADMLARSTVGEVTGAQHDGLAGLEVGRERAKRGRQMIEVVDRADSQRRLSQHLRDLLPLHEAHRQHDALALAHTPARPARARRHGRPACADRSGHAAARDREKAPATPAG
jgi:hypothetical protein